MIFKEDNKLVVESICGDIGTWGGIDIAEGYPIGMLGLKNIPQQEIGTESIGECSMEEAKILLVFHNLEGLDSFINNFTRLRKEMEEALQSF